MTNLRTCDYAQRQDWAYHRPPGSEETSHVRCGRGRATYLPQYDRWICSTHWRHVATAVERKWSVEKFRSHFTTDYDVVFEEGMSRPEVRNVRLDTSSPPSYAQSSLGKEGRNNG